MKTVSSPSCLLLCTVLGLSAQADLIFDVPFENPPHVVGGPPIIGPGGDTPTGTSGIWGITNGLGGNATQLALIESSATGGGLGFSPGAVYSSGVHHVTWDLALLGVSGLSSVQFYGLYGPGLPLSITYSDAILSVFDPIGGTTNVGNAAMDTFHAFAVTFDLDAHVYDFAVDGTPVLENGPISADTTLYGVSVWNPFGSTTLGVDNFRWEIIPEPSTLALLTVAGLGLAFLNRRKPAD